MPEKQQQPILFDDDHDMRTMVNPLFFFFAFSFGNSPSLSVL